MNYLICLTILLFSTSFFSGNSIADQPDRKTTRDVLKKAIYLNEEFKKSVKSLPVEVQQEKRRLLEQYQEKELDEAVRNCIILLSTGNDTKLAVSFLNLLISFENSADETLSYAIGEIFFNNPDLVIKTFGNFNKKDQKTLYAILEWGWENISTERKLPEGKKHIYLKHLQHLKSSYQGKH